MPAASGADALCEALEQAGVRCVFAVPGTQNVALFDALRRRGLRVVLTCSELGAAFMAGAYARVGGHVGVVVTIAGPGFTYALPGLAEARADSAALLHITGLQGYNPDRRFQLQALDEAAIAAPVVKRVAAVTDPAAVGAAVRDALTDARSGEPGPVLLRVAEAALGVSEAAALPFIDAASPRPDPGLAEAVQLFRAARHPVLFVGQGAAHTAPALRRVAEARRAPVMTTPSGRGALPEDHALSFGFDPLRQDVARMNAFLEQADVIVAVGCKLAHNGTAGFTLSLPAGRLIHIDTEPDVLGANYAARLTVCGSSAAFFAALESGPLEPASWTDGDLRQWRDRVRAVRPPDLPEPSVGDGGAGGGRFFAALRRGLPREAIVVTDSGMHQVLTRRYYDVWAPAGLLMPSDFQSMGFGLPAAIGAALAEPTRPVVAILGDGGLRMTGMELATAVREKLRLVAFVFSDGRLNQIRLQQLAEFGREHAVELAKLDLGRFAEAVGAGYVRLSGDPEPVLAQALAAAWPTLVEVPVSDSPSIHAKRVLTLGREAARRALGPRLLSWLRKLR